MDPGTGVAVLVIDDDDALRDCLVAVLADAGYHVHAAVNGAEGIQAMLARRPDVILVDWRMPLVDGLSFRDTQRRLDGFDTIPTIMMSGHATASPARLDSARFLAKPFSMAELLGELRAALDGGAARVGDVGFEPTTSRM